MASSKDDPTSLYKVPKSTTLPSTSRSHLTIHLNHSENHNFQPGELIVGVVTLVSFTTVQGPIIITLTLSGTTNVSLQPSSTHSLVTKKQKLFQLSQVLTQNDSNSNPPFINSFPFTFNFPSHHLDDWGRQQTLPASIQCKAKSPTNATEGSISYKIKATLLSTSKTIKTSVLLYFMNPRTIRYEDIRIDARGLTKTVTYRQSPDTQKARPVRTRDSLPWNKTKMMEEQKLKFEIQLWYLTKIVIGRPFKIQIEVKSTNIEDVKGKGVLPEIRFAKPVEVEVISNIRLKDGAGAQEVHTMSDIFTDRAYMGQSITLDKMLTFNDIIPKGKNISSTFRSKHIDKTTEVMIRISLDIMGKVDKFYVKAEVDVLPNAFGHIHQYDSGELERKPSMTETSPKMNDEPPRYEDLGEQEVSDEKTDQKVDEMSELIMTATRYSLANPGTTSD